MRMVLGRGHPAHISMVFSLLLILYLSGILCFKCLPYEKEFEKALDLVEGKSYSQAADILERLIPKAESTEMKNKYRYVAATCYRKLGRREKAISYYQSVLGEDESQFADLARRHIATAYRDLNNHKLAIEQYEAILRYHPDSLSAVEARYQLGECYFTIGKYEAAIEHYTKFIESYPEESRARMAAYKIGCAYQKLVKWLEAHTQYQGLIRKNMKDEIARNALSKIKLLVSSHPTITITRDDRMSYGLVLYYAGQYKAAREELKKVIQGADNLSAKAAYFIAESYYRENDYLAAIREYRSVVNRYPQSDYDVSSQYQIALCHWKLGREGTSDILLEKFADIYPESDLADDAQFQIAEHYREKEQYRKAADAYSKVAANYPSSSLADQALWNMGWCSIKLKDNEVGEKAFQQLLNGYPSSALAGSARFWMGVSRERTGKWQGAVDAYREAMQNRDWYYSDRAKRRIESLVRRGKISEETSHIQYEKAKIDESVSAWRNIEGDNSTVGQASLLVIARARELMDLRIFDDAIDELMMAVEAAVALESAYYNLAVCYERMEDFSKSRRYAWRLLQLPSMKGEDEAMPRRVYQMSYPIVYRDAVFNYSEKNKLDPLLVLAVMLEESSYEPTAVSSAGARGLMQIMPPTGKDIAGRLKIQPFRTEMLFQPELNIRMGAWYLGDLASRLSGHVQKLSAEKVVGQASLSVEASNPGPEHSDIVRILALGSYHGGESRVRRWVEKYGIEDIDELVESIPIYQTKRYVKKVYDSYETYKSLYSDF